MKDNVITPSAMWDRYFRVRLNYLHSLPMEHIELYGTRISGIEEFDRHLDKDMITTEMSIDMMFERWRKGVTIRVINYDDTAEIYRIIQSHLLTWAEYLSVGINTGGAPLKDLVELDKFAAVVYDKAVSVFSEEEVSLASARNFTNVQDINFNNILKRRRTDNTVQIKTREDGVEVVTISKEEKKTPERNSMSEIFNDQINKNAIWRNRY